MLSYISNTHDPHFVRQRANSLENIAEARTDLDHMHLLLAWALLTHSRRHDGLV